MRHDPLPPFQAEAPVAIPFERLDTLLRHQAREHGMELHSGHGRSTWLKFGDGELGAKLSGQGSVVYARAGTSAWLHTLKETVSYYMAELLNEPALTLVWSGPDQAGQMPPNFSLARVESVRQLGRSFLRMRLRGDRLDRFAREMIHFRLIPPHPEQPTRWPHLSDRGQTIWPQELHRPAYTVAAIDPDAGWMDTDIFVHEGGRICSFAQDALAGTEIGLTGPGGGGVPLGGDILIGGDETAYPALARTIAVQDADAHITCHIFGDTSDYPFPDHPGLSLHHAPAGEAALAAQLHDQGISAEHVWFSTEKARLQPLKAAVLAHLPKNRTHLAAYWNAAS